MIRCLTLTASFILSSATLADSFDELDLDALMAADVQSTSAMKRAQSVQQTSASVYVLSQQEILQSGATTVPEALAQVPGVQVRRIDQNQWAISIRATGGRFSSKLLVMIDGQNIYNPTFSGVYWESVNLPIYDIERIEVIRGPGGLLWSSNASQGVINIITKHAIDTQSAHIEGEVVHSGNTYFSGRWGKALQNDTSFRLYSSYRHLEPLDKGLTGEAYDGGTYKMVGGRLDYGAGNKISVMSQLEWNRLEIQQTVAFPSPQPVAASLLQDLYEKEQVRFVSRLEHRATTERSQSIQLSYFTIDGHQSYAQEAFSHYDLDYQMNASLAFGQLDWGLNYRYNDLPVVDNPFLQSDTGIDSLRQYGAFIQYQTSLGSEQWLATLGYKPEHNSLTGWEHQPSVRLLWQPSEEQAFWASWSRGVLLPGLGTYDYNIQSTPIAINTILGQENPTLEELYLPIYYNGNNQVDSEITNTREIGYRWYISNWKFDISLFQSHSKRQLTTRPEVPSEAVGQAMALYSMGMVDEALAILVANPLLLTMESSGQVDTQGGEVSLHYRASEQLQFELAGSYSDYDLYAPEGAISSQATEDSTRQFYFKVRYQPQEAHSIYLQFRFEDGEAYETEDLRLLDLNWLWQASPNLQLNIKGTNLLANDQLQFGHSRDSFTFASRLNPELSMRLSYLF